VCVREDHRLAVDVAAGDYVGQRALRADLRARELHEGETSERGYIAGKNILCHSKRSVLVLGHSPPAAASAPVIDLLHVPPQKLRSGPGHFVAGPSLQLADHAGHGVVGAAAALPARAAGEGKPQLVVAAQVLLAAFGGAAGADLRRLPTDHRA